MSNPWLRSKKQLAQVAKKISFDPLLEKKLLNPDRVIQTAIPIRLENKKINLDELSKKLNLSQTDLVEKEKKLARKNKCHSHPPLHSLQDIQSLILLQTLIYTCICI